MALHLFDVPKTWSTKVVFDQSVFVKTAIETLLHEGAIGLFLTSVMILIFLGNMRATVAVFFSIPLSALTTFILLSMGGSSINSMVLGGLALAFSRLIDNSVVVLENIFRHLELGESRRSGGRKAARKSLCRCWPLLLTTIVVFFPGDLSIWSQQVSVFGIRSGGGAFAVRLLRGGHDGGAAVLRALHQGGARGPSCRPNGRWRCAPPPRTFGDDSTAGSMTGSTQFLDFFDRVIGVVLRVPVVPYWRSWQRHSSFSLSLPPSGSRLSSRAPIPDSS